jgi:GTP-binding protein HflX
VIIPKLRNRVRSKEAGLSPPSINHQTQEIVGLCSTLDYKICKIYRQNINAPNPTYYLGAGKVDEISEFLEEQENKNHEPLDFAILDCSLRANQIFNLENKFHVRVLDRSALILMIFLHHARTNEAKLQVEYAILNHQIPYVTEVVRRTKLGEHPGYLAGGEYKVDEYFRLTKQRIRKIQGNLKKIKTSREQRRKHRRRSGFQLMTLAGYTNAGKSALLQTLTRAPVLVDDRLFSTVSTKTRRFRASKLLFTDTVGFIRNLPTQLVEAFKSTLEEIIYADHIVLVVDVSEAPEIVLDKIRTSLKTIDQLMSESFLPRNNSKQDKDITERPSFYLIFNKIDVEPLADEKAREIFDLLEKELMAHGMDDYSLISCKTKQGIDELMTTFAGLEKR